MIVLGIDTSCDDTSAGIVFDGRTVLSNVVQSQVALHKPHGGVVPELASREHLKNIMPVVEEALSRAGLGLTDLHGIAVTVGPGLVGSLLVGLYYAKGLSMVHGIPLIGVNHLEGHILSVFLEEAPPEFPFIALTVSGGHSSLYSVQGYGRYRHLGQTLDDAAGEAFDKVAKILGLGYPGGRIIEDLARQGAGDRVRFPRAYLSVDSLDFSFSGLKTAVSLYVREWVRDPEERLRVSHADIAASFQEAVVDVLVEKSLRAWKQTGGGSMVVAGGVACNGRLREAMVEAFSAVDVPVFFPRPAHCTDNGAMIALAGSHRLYRGEVSGLDMDVRSKYPIEDLPPADPRPHPLAEVTENAEKGRSEGGS
jgi:N6-L-threonylcarbamoyladenine synthase